MPSATAVSEVFPDGVVSGQERLVTPDAARVIGNSRRVTSAPSAWKIARTVAPLAAPVPTLRTVIVIVSASPALGAAGRNVMSPGRIWRSGLVAIMRVIPLIGAVRRP